MFVFILQKHMYIECISTQCSCKDKFLVSIFTACCRRNTQIIASKYRAFIGGRIQCIQCRLSFILYKCKLDSFRETLNRSIAICKIEIPICRRNRCKSYRLTSFGSNNIIVFRTRSIISEINTCRIFFRLYRRKVKPVT